MPSPLIFSRASLCVLVCATSVGCERGDNSGAQSHGLNTTTLPIPAVCEDAQQAPPLSCAELHAVSPPVQLLVDNTFAPATSCNGLQCPNLSAAFAKIAADDSDTNYRVTVREGNRPYDDANITLYDSHFKPGRCIIVSAAAGEHPVFDGRPSGTAVPAERLLFLRPYAVNACPVSVDHWTQLAIEGLTVRNYASAAISLAGAHQNRCDGRTWTGGVEIRDCVFENIGDTAFDDQPPGSADCASDGDPPGCGFGAIIASHLRGSVFERNLFDNISNNDAADERAHALYLPHRSTCNRIVDNYVTRSSGSAFKLRDRSDDNVIANNFVGFSARGPFAPLVSYLSCPATSGTSPEIWSRDNQVVGNVFIAPRAASSAQLAALPYLTTKNAACGEPIGPSAYTFSSPAGVYVPSYPTDEVATAMTAGDFDGDGKDEPVIALQSSHPDGTVATRVLTSHNQPSDIGRLLTGCTECTIVAMTSGDFDGDGTPEIVSAIRNTQTDVTEIWRGTGNAEFALDALKNRGRIYTTAGTDWHISALTSGRFGPLVSDGLVIAFVNDRETRVYLAPAAVWGGAVKRLYQSSGFRVTHLAAGDFRGDGTTLLATAFEAPSNYVVYIGDGYSSNVGATNAKKIYGSGTSRVAALSAGNFDSGYRGAGDELVTALDNGATTSMFLGDGWTHWLYGSGATNIRQLYGPSPDWDVTSLTAGDFRADALDEFATGFHRANVQVQVWCGDAATSATGRYTFYQWPQ